MLFTSQQNAFWTKSSFTLWTLTARDYLPWFDVLHWQSGPSSAKINQTTLCDNSPKFGGSCRCPNLQLWQSYWDRIKVLSLTLESPSSGKPPNVNVTPTKLSLFKSDELWMAWSSQSYCLCQLISFHLSCEIQCSSFVYAHMGQYMYLLSTERENSTFWCIFKFY